jgi:hypothetical protein
MMTPGYKTTEFWMGLVGVILTYLNSNLGWNVPIPTVIACLTVIVGYILSRTYLKSKIH